ncbi:porin [Roseateles koreensis]|uniref:Porin n=1 Tax=Roseateles koreensis TaxID=2987526 RepID=A0ABT5KR56_9BURK|nr:porin [Roseateles koreensis]MDC8785399.1 porin [Roseateles koreensis]
MKTPMIRTTRLCLALASCFVMAGAQAQSATEQELLRRVDQLAAELGKLKSELAQLQQQRPPAVAASAATTPAATPPAAASVSTAAEAQPATVITGYAEVNYNRPFKSSKDAQADIRRGVIGYQHRFDDKTKVVTEIEVEHAVASASDPGEVEIEQAYIEHQINPTYAVRGGLFLMPVGLLNENHEPTHYFGVERNFVETAIIPSTWREGGFQLIGNYDNGLTLQAGVTTSFNLNKWDATSTEGKESPLGAIHQEMAQARGHDLAMFGAANWRGIPGLLLGASVFSGEATQKQTAIDSRITLWDMHARWTPGRWDLSALYTRGTISNTALLNAPLVGSATLIPASFDGWYAQAGYKLWESGSYRLLPFARWEQYNTARSYADLGQGLTPDAAATERVLTLGANFEIAEGVVFKVDVQRLRENKDADRLNLGVGWSF